MSFSSSGVGGFASGLQCTSPSLPGDSALLAALFGISSRAVVLYRSRAGDGADAVWEVSGENVCDPAGAPSARGCCRAAAAASQSTSRRVKSGGNDTDLGSPARMVYILFIYLQFIGTLTVS